MTQRPSGPGDLPRHRAARPPARPVELLDAVAGLRDRRGAEVPLVIAGGTTLFDYRDYRRAWQGRALDLGRHPDVLGPVDDEALPSLVAGASAFAFPSTREGLGLAAMEAPVRWEVFAGAARVADSPGTFAAALVEARTAPDRACVDAGRALAARYPWSAAGAEHLTLYQTLRGSAAAAGSPFRVLVGEKWEACLPLAQQLDRAQRTEELRPVVGDAAEGGAAGVEGLPAVAAGELHRAEAHGARLDRVPVAGDVDRIDGLDVDDHGSS